MNVNGGLNWERLKLSMHLGRIISILHLRFWHFTPFILFYFIFSVEKHVNIDLLVGPTTSLTTKFALEWHCSVGPVHCSWDLQTYFFNNFFIKNGSYGTIHIFKNYFVIVFSVFSFQQNKRYPNGPLENWNNRVQTYKT